MPLTVRVRTITSNLRGQPITFLCYRADGTLWLADASWVSTDPLLGWTTLTWQLSTIDQYEKSLKSLRSIIPETSSAMYPWAMGSAVDSPHGITATTTLLYHLKLEALMSHMTHQAFDGANEGFKFSRWWRLSRRIWRQTRGDSPCVVLRITSEAQGQYMLYYRRTSVRTQTLRIVV